MSAQLSTDDRGHSRAAVRLILAAVLAALFGLGAGACTTPAASHGKSLGAKGLPPSAARATSEQEAQRKKDSDLPRTPQDFIKQKRLDW